MIIDPRLLPLWLILCAALPMVALLGVAVRTAPWRGLLSARERQHVLLGGTVGLLLLWLGAIELTEGVHAHLLAVTCMTMTVGWPLALIAGTVALVLQLLLLDVPLAGLPVAWLLTVAVPASGTRLIVHGLRRHGPRNLFIYLLGAGFGGGMASVLLTAAAALLLFALMGRQDWIAGALANGPLVALMMFPEGFLNGMLVTALTVFRPDLMKTFDDGYYLGKH